MKVCKSMMKLGKAAILPLMILCIIAPMNADASIERENNGDTKEVKTIGLSPLYQIGADQILILKSVMGPALSMAGAVFTNEATPALADRNQSPEAATASQIDDILQNKPLFLSFTSGGCRYCADQKPVIAELELEYQNVISFMNVDIADDPDLVAEFEVETVPTMFFILDKNSDGYVYARFQGFSEKPELMDVIGEMMVTGKGAASPFPSSFGTVEGCPAGTDEVRNCGGSPCECECWYNHPDTGWQQTGNRDCVLGDEIERNTTLTKNYYGDDEYGDEFEIITSGVTFDCAGHIIHQGGLRIGYGENNVTIRNCYINNYTDGFGGIYLWHANNATIENNTITGCVRGIKLSYSDDCTVTGNTTNSSEFHGIDISDSDGSQVTGNTCNSNTWGIGLDESNNSTVTGNTANSNEHAGIELDESHDNTVSNNTTNSSQWSGIALWDESSGNTLSGNTANLNGSDGITVSEAGENNIIEENTANSNNWRDDVMGSAGIGVYQTNLVTVDDNTVTDNGQYGISILNVENCAMTGNTMMDNAHNLAVRGTSLAQYNHIIDVDNTVNGKPVYYWTGQTGQQIPADAGYVGIINSTNITVKDLTLTNNRPGVLLAYSTDCTVENNRLNNNYYGIYLQGADTSTVKDNIITENRSNGILLNSESDNNDVYNNFFRENEWNHARDDGSSNAWNTTKTEEPNIVSGPYLGGNYWDDYFGPDADNDRIGDTPYDTLIVGSAGAQDDLPLLAGIVVNSTGDEEDADIWDGVCDVDLVTDGNQCTLRAAIQTTNQLADDGAPNGMIVFDIPAVGVPTIQPQLFLPEVTGPVIIDGTTQPTSDRVEIDGSNAGANTPGLLITGGDCCIKGLVINRFGGDGIWIDNLGGNVIEGNYIGVSATGDQAMPNGEAGIEITESPDNLIGGTSEDARNVISGNSESGVIISGPDSIENRVLGNYIGTDATGQVALGNGDNTLSQLHAGVSIEEATDNIIGGPSEEARNLISGNWGIGVALSGDRNTLQGNYIGTDSTGGTDLGNKAHGVFIQNCSENAIGGTVEGAGNVISGNDFQGILIDGQLVDANNNTINGNMIGTNAAGTDALGNSEEGIRIESATDNVIGDDEDGVRNIISGNGLDGIAIIGQTANGNKIEHNYIGVDMEGRQAIGNGCSGVYVNDASETEVTGANLISGNGHDGILLEGANATDNRISGNYIGIDESGEEVISNGDPLNPDVFAGIRVSGVHGVWFNDIWSNIISGNHGSGIKIVDSQKCDIGSNEIGFTGDEYRALGNGLHGIVLDNSTGNRLNGNRIIDSEVDGIYCCSNSGSNVIKNNEVMWNRGYGIRLDGSSNQLIYNNYFNNTHNAWDNGNNTWNKPKTAGANIFGGGFIGGNYWSDYDGADNNGDDLGDTKVPYKSEGNITNGGDNLPLMHPCATANDDDGDCVLNSADNCNGVRDATNTCGLPPGCNGYEYCFWEHEENGKIVLKEHSPGALDPKNDNCGGLMGVDWEVVDGGCEKGEFLCGNDTYHYWNDMDDDDDGWCDKNCPKCSCCQGIDNCPVQPNPNQEDDDGDAVGNICDNCPAVPNPDQRDSNYNSIGDACDTLPAPVVIINEVYTSPAAPENPQDEWVELYNVGAADADIVGWRILDGDGDLDYAIPADGPDWDGVLEEGMYLVIHIGGVLDTAGEDLYAGLVGEVFDGNGDSVVLLDDGADGRDFVRYGDCADLPSAGTGWNGDNPESTAAGQSLGRDMNSMDSNFGADWENTGGVDVDYHTPGGRNLGLEAEFTASKTMVFLGKAIDFTDQSSGGLPPYTHEWDFDNDTTVDSTQQNPRWTPVVSGTYTVSLTVTDAMLNQDTETKLDYIVVNQEWVPEVYDEDDDEDISVTEFLTALSDYLTSGIEVTQLLQVLALYLQ